MKYALNIAFDQYSICGDNKRIIIQVVQLCSCQVLEAAQLAVVLPNHDCSILCILDKLLVFNAPFSTIVYY